MLILMFNCGSFFVVYVAIYWSNILDLMNLIDCLSVRKDFCDKCYFRLYKLYAHVKLMFDAHKTY